jgi:hypothetical protein
VSSVTHASSMFRSATSFESNLVEWQFMDGVEIGSWLLDTPLQNKTECHPGGVNGTACALPACGATPDDENDDDDDSVLVIVVVIVVVVVAAVVAAVVCKGSSGWATSLRSNFVEM